MIFWKKRKKTLRELINELKQINKCFNEEKERYSFENAKKIKEKTDKERINFFFRWKEKEYKMRNKKNEKREEVNKILNKKKKDYLILLKW